MPKVTFQNSGESTEAEEGKDLKEITKENKWSLSYACESGTCGTCLIKIVEGKENLSKMEETEKATLDAMGLNDGEHRLACQCKIKGDVTIQAG